MCRSRVSLSLRVTEPVWPALPSTAMLRHLARLSGDRKAPLPPRWTQALSGSNLRALLEAFPAGGKDLPGGI